MQNDGEEGEVGRQGGGGGRRRLSLLPVLIFLDIDGVLLPFGGGKNKTVKKDASTCGAIFPDRTLEALAKILDSVNAILSSSEREGAGTDTEEGATAAKIVLSSTWRVRESFRKQIVESLRLFGYAYGSSALSEIRDFYDVTDPDHHGERQHEIYRWLASKQQEQQQQQQQNGTGAGEREGGGDAVVATPEGGYCCWKPKTATGARAMPTSFCCWIAIDDEELLDGKANAKYRDAFVGRVVKPDSSVGLTDADADLAIKLLKDQIEGAMSSRASG